MTLVVVAAPGGKDPTHHTSGLLFQGVYAARWRVTRL